MSAAPSFSTQPFQWKEGLDKHVFTYSFFSGGGPTCCSSHTDPVQPGHADAHQLFTLNGRDVPVEIAWVHLREGYPDNVHLVVVDLTDCPFTAHDCRENKCISRRDHAVQWPLKRPTRRGCVRKIINLKDVKGYLSQFNTVDPHYGWPLFIGALGHR
ncbi:hypothetical protein CEXT_300891 [Caerostris extrusa]|uniref:Uncharacterized protein n=1 Tax=Caerostris extrusa TaxID=172846 RepID=A0AAV4MUZ7_CAEEX|nr:hypothetical protein CEXT_300891 [Caerostris extrusa]